MNDYIDQAFNKMSECMKLMEKAINSAFKGKTKSGTKILIKKNSTIYLGKGIYATLTEDVHGIVK
jgi:hypothetical protein